ncbi:MAG: tetratricopeptide repeat protein [Myxococcota bacterium]
MKNLVGILMMTLGACDALEELVAGEAPPVEVAPPTVVPVTTSSEEARASFEAGMVALDNIRGAEAIFDFDQALELDPGFVRAKAMLGSLKPGNEGLALLVEANEAAGELPEAERILIQSMLANAKGRQAESIELLERVAELAPKDWRVQMQLGNVAFFQDDYDAALNYLQKATELSPDAGPAWNMLGYTRAQLGDFDGAVASFDRYIGLAPNEANPHDSKGEILLEAGRFADSEAAFTESTKVDQSFFVGWFGIAQTRFLRGDWEGGMAAIDKGHQAATTALDKSTAHTAKAWALAAQGDRAGAEATLAEAGQQAKAQGLNSTYAFAALTRGRILLSVEAWSDAAKAFDEALARLKAVGLQGGFAEELRDQAALGKAHAAARRGNVEEARETLHAITDKLVARPGLKNDIAHLHGVLDIAVGDIQPGIFMLETCPEVAFRCRHDLAKAQAAAGQDDAANATLAKIKGHPFREAAFLPVWVAAGVGSEALE